MNLLIGFYQDRHPARVAELLDCLARNLASPHLESVRVFLEEALDVSCFPLLADPKVRLVEHGHRVTFGDLFAYANRELRGQRVIIANNDIYFDRSLARLEGYALSGRLLCLSRWDIQRDGSASFFDHPWSQDAWIFEAPVPTFPGDWHLGIPGCENRLAFEAQAVGLEVINPSRTLRANHLHLSQVRHYVEQQRLAGHGRGIEPTWLGSPWLWPIVPCMGQLHEVAKNFGSLMSEPCSSPVLVDYACPDRAGEWVRSQHPDAVVVSVLDRHSFNAGEARNAGAAAADDDAVLCFLEAQVAVHPEFATTVLGRIDHGCFLVPDELGPGSASALVCHKSTFDQVGGYDTTYWGPGAESLDLRSALLRAGLAERTFSASLLRLSVAAAGSARFHPLPEPKLAEPIDAAYRRIKDLIVSEVGHEVSVATLREIHRALTHRKLVEQGLTPDVPCGSIAFRETMGYTVARLEPGISSHNNDSRPFEEIPAPLHGLAFTQVAASRVSPVNIEFCNSGKVFVLVGTDWNGYHPSTAFLRRHGYREPLPPVRTRRGTAFEVWSLIGDAGYTIELPTQVMLAARSLVAR